MIESKNHPFRIEIGIIKAEIRIDATQVLARTHYTLLIRLWLRVKLIVTVSVTVYDSVQQVPYHLSHNSLYLRIYMTVVQQDVTYRLIVVYKNIWH